MRLSDCRLKFAELIGPWTADPPDKKKLTKPTIFSRLGTNGLILSMTAPVLTLLWPKEEKIIFQKKNVIMRLSGDRLRFAELTFPWIFNHSDKKKTPKRYLKGHNGRELQDNQRLYKNK